MSAKPFDTWRVETPEGMFETDLDTLKQWIAENCVLPTDKVARGNLHWIEAGRVPLLRPAFAGKAAPPPSAPKPETVSAASGQPTAPAPTAARRPSPPRLRLPGLSGRCVILAPRAGSRQRR